MKDTINLNMLMSIKAVDFLQAGRFSHLHIPKYVYVPAEIAAVLNVKQERIHSHHVIIWRRLYVAHREAQSLVEADPGTWLQRAEDLEDSCPWISMLMDKTIVKSFDFDVIYMVQMAEANRTLKGSQIHILSPCTTACFGLWSASLQMTCHSETASTTPCKTATPLTT